MVLEMIPPGVFSTIWLWVRIIGAVILTGVIGYFTYMYMIVYKIKVTVHKKIGHDNNGHMITRKLYDRARLIERSPGEKTLMVMKLKKGRKRLSCPFPEDKYKSIAGSRDHYDLLLDDNGMLHPLDVYVADNNKPTLEVWSQDRRAWAKLLMREQQDKIGKQSFLEKYGALVAWMGTLLVSFLVLFFLFQYVGNGFMATAGAIKEMTTTCLSARPLG